MSLYAEYIKEREGKEIIETEFGFTTYFLNSDEIYLVDMYIKPEFRGEHLSKYFVGKLIEVAKENNCEKITTTVCPTAMNSTTSLHVVLGNGFKLKSSVNNLILFEREL